MRKFRALLLSIVLLVLLASPAPAAEILTLHALLARTGPGTGPAIDLGNYRNVTIHARVTAGSGTVNPFDVWIECSADAVNFTECAIDDRVKGTTTGAGTFTDNTVKLIAEVAVITSGTWSAKLTTPVQSIRARWNIVGTTPSETFEVLALGR
jgi:hypothetical protein